MVIECPRCETEGLVIHVHPNDIEVIDQGCGCTLRVDELEHVVAMHNFELREAHVDNELHRLMDGGD